MLALFAKNKEKKKKSLLSCQNHDSRMLFAPQNDNPMYKGATTTYRNPMLETNDI